MGLFSLQYRTALTIPVQPPGLGMVILPSAFVPLIKEAIQALSSNSLSPDIEPEISTINSKESGPFMVKSSKIGVIS